MCRASASAWGNWQANNVVPLARGSRLGMNVNPLSRGRGRVGMAGAKVFLLLASAGSFG